MTKIILASQSPRRKELLRKITEDFEVITSDVEETEEGEPLQIAEENALRKGRAVPGYFVLSCDTVVASDGRVYGKPKDEEDAVRMLTELSGKTHYVISAVYFRVRGEEHTFSDQAEVTFYPLTKKEIENYVKEYRPLDKAGAYGIQDGVCVRSYKGSFDTIMGLPTEKLACFWKEYIYG